MTTVGGLFSRPAGTEGGLRGPGCRSVGPDVDRLLYGFPAFEGRGVKVGLDDGPLDPLGESPPPAVTELATLEQYVRRYVPAADGPVESSLTCRYTLAPRNRFAIGPVPGRPATFVAAACSGHGFKVGPAIGAALADLVEGVDRPDLDFLTPEQML